MPISASQVVEVSPRLLKSASNSLEFNGLLLSKSDKIPFKQVLAFVDPLDVALYFGELSVEASLAEKYFLGYKNSYKKPRLMYIARYIDEEVSAWLRGGEILLSIDDLKNLTDMQFEITINNNQISLSSLDFTSISSYSDLARILENAMKDAMPEDSSNLLSVEYSALYKSIRINCFQDSATSENHSNISYATNTLAEVLCLTKEKNAVLSESSPALTASENMELILEQTQNFVNFTTSWLPSKEEVLDLARFTTSKNTAYLFLYSDTDNSLLLNSINNTNTIAYAIKENNLSAVAGQYTGQEYSVFLMGLAASIDWDNIDSTVNTAFKSQDGLMAVVENSSHANNLIANGMNFVGDYATRNDNFIFHYPGQMFGDYKWIDSYWNAIWLNNALEVALLDGLSSSPRTPYTEKGYALIRAWMNDPIKKALKNNVIESNVSLSETQKAMLNREAGKNIDHEISTSGYYIQIEDPGAEARAQRQSPLIKLWYTYGGSVNKLSVSSSSIL